VFLEKQIKMRTELDTEYGIANEKTKEAEQAARTTDETTDEKSGQGD
jgi:hypothetical protein